MASPNGKAEQGPPLNRAHTEEPRPGPKFRVRACAIVQAKGEHAHKSNSVVIEIKEIEFVDDPRHWQYTGVVVGTQIRVSAPESDLRQPKHAIGRAVQADLDYTERNRLYVRGHVKAFHTDKDGNIIYEVGTTFDVDESDIDDWFSGR